MHVLPDVTRPSATRLKRRHAPASGRWKTFRPCLRWEFGFTCAFCLLHEADLEEDGAEGAGRMTIEHRQGRRARPAAADLYRNCFLACRYCNEARATRPTRDRVGRKLLDPVSTPWASHFHAEHGRLKSRADDRDADYTHVAYDLDDERKIRKRLRRLERIPAALETATLGPRRAAMLVDLAAETESDVERRELLATARGLHIQAGFARSELRRYRLVPEDADRPCRCAADAAVPVFIDEQSVETAD